MPHKHEHHKDEHPKHEHHKHEHTHKKHHHPPGLLETKHLKRIESLRNVYKGQEIWVLATGPSLEDIPDNFLTTPETKISIAVKEAAMAFPDCTYNIFPFRDNILRKTYLSSGRIPSNFGKFIFSIRKNDTQNFYGKRAQKATFIRFVQGGTVERLRSMCASIVAGNSSVYYGMGTITHLAIASALVMGASKISLVGCEHGETPGHSHALTRGMSALPGFKESNIGMFHGRWMDGWEPMRVGTNFLADYFRDHGVEIVRYYHAKGYEPIGRAKEEAENG